MSTHERPGAKPDIYRYLRENETAERAKILQVTLILTAILGFPTLAASVYVNTGFGLQGHALSALQICCFLAILSAAIFHKRWSLTFRASLFIGSCFLLGVGALLARGLMGMGLWFITIVPVYTVLFFGLTAGLAAVIASLMVMVGMVAGLSLGWLSFPLDLSVQSRVPIAWISRITLITLLTTVAVIVAGRLHRHFRETIDILGERTDKLHAATGQLEEEIGRRKLAEHELVEERDLARLYLDTAGVFMLALDKEGTVTLINKKGCQILGCEPGEVQGKNWFDAFVAESERERTRTACEDLLKKGPGTSEAFETLITTGNGEERIIAWKLTTLTDTHQGAIGILGSGEDVTELKKAQEALVVSESRYRWLVEASPVGIVLLQDWRFVFANPSAAKGLGFSQVHEVIGRNLVDFVALQEGESIEQLTGSVAESQRSLMPMEIRILRVDGTSLFAELLFVPTVFDSRPATLCMAMDSTARKEAELKLLETYTALQRFNAELEDRVRDRTEALERANRDLQQEIAEKRKTEDTLRQSEDRYRVIVETSSEGIAVMDAGLCVAYVNRVAAEMLGYSEAEMIGKSIEHIVCPDQMDDHLRRMEKRREGLSEKYEAKFRRKDGSEIWVLVSASPLMDSQGLFAGSFGMFSDITERKRMEQDLIIAKEAAEAANRAKSEFLARMSHEIRTPLNGIVGMSQLALDTELTAEQRRYLQSVTGSADMLTRLIDDILDFSRIEAGKLALTPAEFSLRDGVFEALEPLWHEAASKGLELVCRISPEVPDSVVGDASRLGQVLGNLAGNAIKFTEKGQIAVSVQMASRVRESISLLFSVRDTGLGIAPEKQQKVFSPFEQADGSVRRRFGGTGLGLSICSQIVTMMGGRIWLDSDVGVGSTFYFTINLGTVPEVRAASGPHQAFSLSNVMVMVVDNDEASRASLHDSLAGSGLRPVSVPTGPAAMAGIMEALEKGQPFELVVIGATTDEAVGTELQQAIRNESNLKDLPVVMLGPARADSETEGDRRHGSTSFFPNPVEPRELLFVVWQAMQGKTHEKDLLERMQEAFPVSPRPLSILLVEDTVLNREVASKMLEKMGHRVTLALDGKEALSMHRGGAFDLILMDVEMPEMDGLEATRIIRKREQATGAHIPVIAMTAHAMTGDRERILAAGMDEYIAKPVRTDVLFNTIESLGKSRGKQSTKASGEGPAPLNWRELLEDMDGDVGFLHEIFDLFLREAPGHIRKIQEAVTEGDAEGLSNAAHRLKGTAATLRATSTRDLALSLEDMGRDGDLEGAVAALQDLEREMTRLTEAIAALRDHPEIPREAPSPNGGSTVEVSREGKDSTDL